MFRVKVYEYTESFNKSQGQGLSVEMFDPSFHSGVTPTPT